jgi:probable F420-dependent oxidoreductase
LQGLTRRTVIGFKVNYTLNEDTLANAEAAALRAERLGFDGIDFPESAHDAFLPCLIAAGRTSRLKVATAVAIAFPRSPMVAAMLAWDLQAYSKGRFTLGLGTQVKGHNQRRFSVPWSPPAPRLRDYVKSLRAIWASFQTGEKLSYVGEHYSFTLMNPNFNPGPIDYPAPPVHLAALNERNARVAGEVADGIRLHPLNSPGYLRDILLPSIEKGLAVSGRTLESFEVCGGGLLATGQTWSEVEQNLEGVKRWLSFYGSTRSYQGVLNHEGWLHMTAQLHEMSLKGQWREMQALIPEDMARQFAIVAPYDQLAQACRERFAGVVNTLSFSDAFHDPAHDEQIASVVKDLQSGG